MDLAVVHSGEQRCPPMHAYGPAVRACYLFHYIVSGRGVYEVDGRTYHLHAGQGFVIFPGVITRYEADKNDPWHYAWLGFRGEEAAALVRSAGLSEAHPVFDAAPAKQILACLRQIHQDLSVMPHAASRALASAGGVLRFIAYITPSAAVPVPPSGEYCDKALWYIRAHLENAVTVSQIAAFVGLSRSQLFRVFREHMHCSPSEALARARADHARQLLRDTKLTLPQIAAACGYAGAAHLCTAFRRDCGMTPAAWRKSHT